MTTDLPTGAGSAPGSAPSAPGSAPSAPDGAWSAHGTGSPHGGARTATDGARPAATAGEPADPGGRAPYPRSVLDWIGLVCRLGLGGVLIAAGLPKLLDVTGSIQNVVAYQLFDYEVSRLIGTSLPVVEIAVGLLLVAGLLTRGSAAVGGLLMIVFIAGIISAWTRGLAIDCGCFGTGGPVAPEETTYLLDIVRDIGFLALAGWLVVRPRTPFALDNLLQKGR